MKETYNAIFLDEAPLIAYLRDNSKWIYKKHYEIVVAIWLRRILTMRYGKEHCIAFELKDDLKRLIPDFSSQKPIHIREILDTHRKEGAHDVFIPRGTAANHESEGPAFELKRFMSSDLKQENFINKLKVYAEQFAHDYGKTNAVLIILPVAKDRITLSSSDTKRLSNELLKLDKNFPFAALWLLSQTPDMDPYMTQYWPAYNPIGSVSWQF